MTARRVIAIDVEDSSFKKFATAFSAFNQAVKDSLSDVHALNRAQSSAAKDGEKDIQNEEKAVEKLAKTRKKVAKEEKAERKEKAEDQKKQDEAERKAAAARKKDHDDIVKSSKDLAKWTGEVAWNTGRAAVNVAKWAVIGGLTSGFGFGALASGASNARRQSQGLGIDSGELRAAGVNFGKYVDSESMLERIADAQSSYGKQNLFNRIGVNAAGKDPAELMAEMLPKLVQRFKQVGGKEEAANALGLTDFATMADLRRLSSLTEKELSDTIAAYRKDRESLHVNDSTNRDWQSFLVALKRAGEIVETSFIRHLSPLAPKLEGFAQGLSKAIDTFLGNADLEKWIKKLGTAIEETATYLGSDEFKTDVTTFLHAIHTMATWITKLFPGDGPANPNDTVANEVSKGVYGSSTDDLEAAFARVDKFKAVKNLEQKYSLPAGLLDTVWNNESSRGRNSGLSSAGALGDFQQIPSTALAYGVKDRTDFTQSSDAAARMLRDLLKHYAGDQAKALAAYNWGMGNLDRDIAVHGKDWQKYAPQETQKYVSGVHIQIMNNTGGNAQATIAALNGGAG